MKRHGFTLIELLIVVAIIAILAAIAVPNFLEAQVRAKVSRTKNDMRTYATALESYRVDNNAYPVCHRFGVSIICRPANGCTGGDAPPTTPFVLEILSTPISYLSSSALQSPFTSPVRKSAASARLIADSTTLTPIADPGDPAYKSYIYQSFGDLGRASWSNTANPPAVFGGHIAQGWILHSPGPEQIYYNLGGVLAGSSIVGATAGNTFADCLDLVYDPTNGTVSAGAIWRNGGNTNGNYAYNMNQAINAQR